MLSIIHGDDLVLTRNKLSEIVSDFQVVSKFDGKNVTYDDLVADSLSYDLFFEKKVIVVENYFARGGSSNKKISDYLVKILDTKDIYIILWEDTKIDGRILKKFSNAKILLLEQPKEYFLFLDSLKPLNDTDLKTILDRITQSFSPEMLFYSIIKRIKTLILLKENMTDSSSETKFLQPWLIRKLQAQCRFWTIDQLQLFLNKLFDIEKRLKTSGLPLTLSKHVEILLFSTSYGNS